MKRRSWAVADQRFQAGADFAPVHRQAAVEHQELAAVAQHVALKRNKPAHVTRDPGSAALIRGERTADRVDGPGANLCHRCRQALDAAH